MVHTTLIIARHGNTFAAGEVVRRVGITDLPLVQSGVEQGERLAEHLLNDEVFPCAIFTSQLQRTKQMAEIFCDHASADIPTTALKMFNEIDYGIDENQPEHIVTSRLGDALTLWESHAIPPKEWNINTNDIIQNWCNFADETLSIRFRQATLVFTSNGIARFAPHISDNPQIIHNLKLATGAFATFQHDGDNWSIKNWNTKP